MGEIDVVGLNVVKKKKNSFKIMQSCNSDLN